MNTQDNFINAVKEVKSYMYDRRNCNYLTDEQAVLIEGELTMFLTNAFIKQAEAEKKEETCNVEITNDQFRQWIAHIYELQQAERPNNEYRIIANVTLDDITADIKRMFGLDDINGDISQDEFLTLLKEQRDLIQRLVKESKSNRV